MDEVPGPVTRCQSPHACRAAPANQPAHASRRAVGLAASRSCGSSAPVTSSVQYVPASRRANATSTSARSRSMPSRSRGKSVASLIDRHRNRAPPSMAYCSVVAQVRLEHITKEFGEGAAAVKAVDDVSLEIEDHDFMILLGPSGCGKSTLLRMVAGLENPTSGEIFIGNTKV